MVVDSKTNTSDVVTLKCMLAFKKLDWLLGNATHNNLEVCKCEGKCGQVNMVSICIPTHIWDTMQIECALVWTRLTLATHHQWKVKGNEASSSAGMTMTLRGPSAVARNGLKTLPQLSYAC